MEGKPLDAKERRSQQAVLTLILSEYPDRVTVSAVQEAVEESVGAERAIDDLEAVGLLVREGEAVLPTPAALHLDRLKLKRDGSAR